ncbi:MAG: hypothetical protein ACRD6X_20815 [Pyrinomonadaceae bacterium]
MNSKLRVVKTAEKTEQPEKAKVSEKDFRRKLKNIEKWRKEHLAEIRAENPR